MIVDCHALIGKGLTWAEPEAPADYDVAALLDRGAQAGIARHCVMPARSAAGYEAANRELARTVEGHPDRLIGFAAHSPQREAGRLRQLLTDEVRSMGLRGVRFDGHPGREAMDAAAELGIPVMYYPRLASGQGPARWYHMLAEAYPRVNVFLPHLGLYRSLTWWAHVEAIDLARRDPNVYLDTSGLGSFKYLEMAVRDLPVEKLLFGTAAPELDARVERQAVRLLKLDRAHEDKLLGANFLRLVKA
jgi:predicted TIM-barrel fold metal-dependent hydrolase